MALLSRSKVDQATLRMHGWHRREQQLVKVYPAWTRADAVQVAARMTGELEPLSHEPTMGVRVDGSQVHVDIYTPDEGGITEADIHLAERLDVVASRLKENVRVPFGA